MAGFFDDFGIGDAINIGTALISGASSIFGSNAQANAADKASSNSLAFQDRIYNEALNDRIIAEQAGFKVADMMGVARPTFAQFAPRAPGAVSGLTPAQLSQIPSMTGSTNFEGSPGYQFRLQQGQKALDNNLAASGLLRSGSRVKATNDYAQGQASQEVNNQFNQLMALRGGSQANVGNSNNLAGAALADANQSLLSAGTARASGFTGAANALNNFGQNAVSLQAARGRP
jgi:hypothetical protein